MSAIDDLTLKPFTPAAAPGPGALDKMAATPPPVAKAAAPAGLDSLVSKPFATTPAPTAPAAPSPYFQSKTPSGAFLGISDEKDTSGVPYMAYRLPGANATTTDYTRVATQFDPRLPQKLDPSIVHNDRMSTHISGPIREALGANYSDELDHTIALELSGSNNPANLRVEAGRVGGDSADFDKEENQLARQVVNGSMSLWDAQYKLASDKAAGGDKNPIPWIDKTTPPEKAGLLEKIIGAPANSTLGVIKNTILGLPHAAGQVASAIGGGIKGLAAGIAEQYTNPSPLEQGMEKNVPGILRPIEAPILRTIEPMVEPLAADVAAGVIFNNPDLYETLLNNIQSEGEHATEEMQTLNRGIKAGAEVFDTVEADAQPNWYTAMLTGATQKSTAQIIGDTAQAVLGAYFPDILGGSLETFAKKGIAQGLTAAATHGAAGGLAFGAAQAASSGSHDPKEIAAIVFKNMVAGALLNTVAAGVTHGVAKTAPGVIDIIKSRLPQNLQEAQRGFIKNPFAEGGKTPEPEAVQKEKQNLAEEYKKSVYDDGAGTSLTGDQAKQNHLGEMLAGWDLAEPGYRYATDESHGTDWRGVPSTFPQYLDEGLRSKALFDSLRKKLENYDYPPARNVRQRAFMDAFYDELDHRTGVDTSDIRGRIKEHYDSPATQTTEQGRKGEAANGRARGREGAAGDEGIRGAGGEIKKGARVYGDLEAAKARATETGTSALTDLALSLKTPHDFFLALTPAEQERVLHISDPDGKGMTHEEAAHAFYSHAQEHVAPRDTELPKGKTREGTSIAPRAQHIKEILDQERAAAAAGQKARSDQDQAGQRRSSSYDPITTDHNGGVEPPENKGGMQPPELDWSKGKEISAIRQSTDTLERTLEKVFPPKEAGVLNEFLTQADRKNEASKVRYVSGLRKETKAYVVDNLGIKPATVSSALVQRYGEGRLSLDELKAAAPKNWENITKAAEYFRKKYDTLINDWNKARVRAGLKPIGKKANYFRHFIDLSGFAHMYGLDFRESNLPTAISGITEYFRSQAPWTNAAMRRLGSTTTDDAVGGFDNYLDTVGRAIFHTDTVQRGRLVEKYLRNSAEGNMHAAQDIRDSGEQKDVPPPINLPRLAQTLKGWADKVSGKQNIFDRSLEAMVGRPALAAMRSITRQFGLNVIGGNLSAAATHVIPINYTFATTDKGAIVRGLFDMTTAPFLEDFTKIDGISSDFLARRFGVEEISPTLGEKVGAVISSPFHWVDQFISRVSVASKYFEGLTRGLDPKESMRQADNYASRVVGDRSSGNLPPLMSTKTLGWFTQFQIEVNDNLHVLLHDIPTWEGGNPAKIAGRFMQFAIFAFLTNHLLNYLKGSGKGLDPIDLGLTLAGLNDEGHDETLMNRLGMVGLELLKELPFTSIPTGGQVPALQPLIQSSKDLSNGQYMKSVEGLLASFASPVGGGMQLQKTLGAIDAWKQGYVTDSNGKIVAKIPHTLSTLLQGVAFGKNAFTDVKKSKLEISNIDATLRAQQQTGVLKNQQASNLWKELHAMPAEDAKQKLLEIAQQDPDMAKRVISFAKNEAAGITKPDVLLKSLGVASGARANYIAQQLQGMSTDEEKKQYLLDLSEKKILTAEVLKQVVGLMNK